MPSREDDTRRRTRAISAQNQRLARAMHYTLEYAYRGAWLPVAYGARAGGTIVHPLFASLHQVAWAVTGYAWANGDVDIAVRIYKHTPQDDDDDMGGVLVYPPADEPTSLSADVPFFARIDKMLDSGRDWNYGAYLSKEEMFMFAADVYLPPHHHMYDQ